MKCAGVMKLIVTRWRVDRAAATPRVPPGRIDRGRRRRTARDIDVPARPGVVRGSGEQVHVVGEPPPERDLTLLRQLRPRPVERRRARRPSAGPSFPTCRTPARPAPRTARDRPLRRRRPRSACPRGRGRRRAPCACESSTMYATSSGLRCVLTSTTEPCSFETAAQTSKNATEFGSMIATRSATPTPRAARPRRDEIAARDRSRRTW